jgi:anti-sigma factor RsiW
MSCHLSSEQISAWTLGEYSSDIEQHLADCAACRAEVASLKLSLSSFRESAHNWADQQCVSEAQTIQRIRRAPLQGWLDKISLAAALATVLCMVAVFSLRQHSSVPVSAASSMDDTVLLRTVNEQVSETLPRSLTPLTKVVSWENAYPVARTVRQ